MVQTTTLLMGCLIFTMGVLLGLLVHLPLTSSPGNSRRHTRDAGLWDANGNALDEISLEGSAVGEDKYRSGSHGEPTRTVVVKASENLPVNSTGTDKQTSANDGTNQKETDQRTFVRGVYWTSDAEALSHQGFTADSAKQWRAELQNNNVISMSAGCGRMQNRLLLLSDATQACARYRLNTDQIQGEVYSYYLSRVLGLSHVPPSVLVQTNPRDERWRRVHQAVAAAKWSPDRVAVVTPWIEGLRPAYIPTEFQTSARSLHPDGLAGKSDSQVRELVQWSDLIVFDYLTANLDRVVNNMFNEQWNPDMMRSPAHNLETDPRTGHLVFLDNESGLFHSYRLLDKYGKYHESLLKSLCVFRPETAGRIRALVRDGRVGTEIMDLFQQEDPLAKQVARMPEKTLTILRQRLSAVADQIDFCESLYKS